MAQWFYVQEPVSLKGFYRTLVIFTVCLIFIPVLSVSQKYRVLNVNTDDYPYLSVHFNTVNNRIISDSLISSDIRIFEDGKTADLIDFDPVSFDVIPASVIIALDVSASMSGERIKKLKEATKEAIRKLHLEINEVAIVTFNGYVMLNCDFTHNENMLLEAVDNIQTAGSTDFNNAFLKDKVGILDISEQSKFQRDVIFISDGEARVDFEEVISKANQENIRISCLTIELRTPQSLKNIASRTGGWYQGRLKKDVDIISKYLEIYDIIQQDNHGYIKWKATPTCKKDVDLKLNLKGEIVRLNYTIPDWKIKTVDLSPSDLSFVQNETTQKNDQILKISPSILQFTIEGIYSSDTNRYSVEDLDYPIKIGKYESKEFRFSYRPIDHYFTSNQFIIKSEECPDIAIDAFGGTMSNLKITSPLKGDILIAGNTSPIKWKGVSKNTLVKLYLSDKLNATWKPIGKDINFLHYWNVPHITGDSFYIKAECSNEINHNTINQSFLSIDGRYSFVYANYTDTGNEIITSDERGNIKSWDSNTGDLILDFEKPYMSDAIYHPKSNRVIAFSNNSLNVFTNRNGKYIATYHPHYRRIRTSFITNHGKEYYSYIVDPNQVIIWDPLQNMQTYNPSRKKVEEAAFSYNGDFVMTLTDDRLETWNIDKGKKWTIMRLGNEFESAIFHSSRNIVSINFDNRIEVIDVENKSSKYRIPNETFLRFSPKGKYLISQNRININIHHLLHRRKAFSSRKSKFLYFSDNEEYILLLLHDTLKVVDLIRGVSIFERYEPYCHDAQFYPNSSKILIKKQREIEVWNYLTGKSVYELDNISGQIQDVDISPDERELIIASNKEVMTWQLSENKDTTITGPFSIISPKPTIRDELFFDKVIVNTSKEVVFNDFISNSSDFNMRINKILIENDIDSEYYLVSVSDSVIIKPGESEDIEIGFCPVLRGSRRVSILVITPMDTLRCYLSGEGVLPDLKLLTHEIDFGEIPWGKTKDTIVDLLLNTGDLPQGLKSIDLSQLVGQNFELINPIKDIVLNPNDTLTVDVRFNPKRTGIINDFLDIEFSDISTNLKCELIGICMAKKYVFIKGRTLDQLSGNSLQSSIICTDLLSGNKIKRVTSNQMGDFLFPIHTGRNYSLHAELKGYISSSANIDLTTPVLMDTIYQDIFLNPLQKGGLLRLNNIFFEFASAELSPLSYPELQRIIEFLNSDSEAKIEIHGHTDNIGEIEYNQDLSKSRAGSVKNYIIRNNVDRSRLIIKAFGESQPVATNNTDQGRKLNRRVEIKIIKDTP